MALDVAVQLYIDGVWTTYTCYDAEGWRTRIGPDVESGFQPNRIEFTLANDDLSMDPTNPSSSLYGKIGRNTRARLAIDGSVITRGEASSWRPSRTLEHVAGLGRGRSTMSVIAEGLQRRLGRWEDPLDSPLRRFTSGTYTSAIGYWPLEDPSGSANLAQLVTGAQAGTYSGTVTLGGDSGAGGSDPCLTISTDARVDGRFKASSASGWGLTFCAKLAAAPASAAFNVMFAFVDTLGRTWSWQVSNTLFRIAITADDGTVLKQTDVSYGTLALTGWVRYRIKATVSGGTLTFEPAWFNQDGTVLTGTTDTFASSSTGQPRDWRLTYNSYVDGAAFGHVFATSDPTVDLLSSQSVDAFDGFLGERASVRFGRLMGELGLTGYISGSTSVAMGRQRSGTLLELLREIADTEGGLIYDEPLGEIGLTFRTYDSLINQSPEFALTYGTNVSPPLDKIIDDVGVVNDVTLTNWDGTQVHIEETAGALSTDVPPAGVGRYRKSLAVSFASPAQLVDRGNWELANGTLNRARYANVTVNLLAFSSFRTAVIGTRPGDIISLAGIEPDTVYLRVLTVELSGNAAEISATFSCVPADVYDVGEYDDGTHLYDSGDTTLKTGVSSSATSLTFRTAVAGNTWSTVSEPYDVMIAGERITVTNMGAASLVSGAYDQTATVTRAVNGVSKAQSAGAEIHVAKPARWGLGEGN